MKNEIVNQMYNNDSFSKWLGIEVLEAMPGECKLQMIIREEMCNGFGVAHGGITYSLADSALAFASNAHGRISMSIETSVSHLSKVALGDKLTAMTKEIHLNHKVGVYGIKVVNQDGVKVADFKGTVYRSSKEW